MDAEGEDEGHEERKSNGRPQKERRQRFLRQAQAAEGKPKARRS